MKDYTCIVYKSLWKAYVHATIYMSLKSFMIQYFWDFSGSVQCIRLYVLIRNGCCPGI